MGDLYVLGGITIRITWNIVLYIRYVSTDVVLSSRIFDFIDIRIQISRKFMEFRENICYDILYDIRNCCGMSVESIDSEVVYRVLIEQKG